MSEDVPSLKRIAEPRSLKPAPGVVVGYRRVRTKGQWIQFVISVVILIVGFILVSSPILLDEGSANVDKVLQPGEEVSWDVPLDEGEQIIIEGTVYGGNDDIFITVDEGGFPVKVYGWVKSPVNVAFTAQEKGTYTVVISNKLSLVTEKEVHLKITRRGFELSRFFGEFLVIVGLVGLVIDSIMLAIGNQKRIVLKVDGEVYEFWPTGRWKLGVAVNGATLDSKVEPGDKFRIGSNDEHVLEIKKISWRQVGFFIDGREVGRLP